MTTLSIIILFASSVAGSVFLGILLDVWFYTRKKDRIKKPTQAKDDYFM